MSEEAIPNRYGKALFEVASQQGGLERINKELISIGKLLEEHPDLITILNHPAIKISEKKSLLEELFRDKPLSLPLKLFLYLLVKNGRLMLLEDIIKVYQQMLDAHQRRLVVRVISAFPLFAQEQLLLEERLAALFNKKVKLKLKVDKALLGGIKIKVADTIYDGSLRGRLERIKAQLS